jgi:hypothetical protein
LPNGYTQSSNEFDFQVEGVLGDSFALEDDCDVLVVEAEESSVELKVACLLHPVHQFGEVLA